jgi:hypothetical protein
VLRNGSAQVWNTSTAAFETYTLANYASYAVSLTEQGATGFYVGNFPGAIATAGRYSVDVRLRAGATPAATDSPVAAGSLVWNGTAETFVVGNATGQVDLDLGQAIPTNASGLTLGRALLAAIAQGVGVWKYDPTHGTLVEYAEDGSTVLRSFALTIDGTGTITQRT